MSSEGVVVQKKRGRPRKIIPQVALERPPLPPVDPLYAAQEAARHAQEGNVKLSRAVDCLRQALETITIAEMDRQTGLPVSAKDLRQLAVEGLDQYSTLCGQPWRRNRIITSRAGDRNLDFANA